MMDIIFLPAEATLVFALCMPLLLTALLIPGLRLFALRIRLVDKPDQRKLHTNLIPLVGGLGIWLAASATYAYLRADQPISSALFIIWAGSGIMLLVGLLDDFMNLRAVVKLIIQIGLAYYAFSHGLRLESLYGVFGIETLPVALQYLLTLLVIAGVINAFNLMDGIDGLAAMLGIIGLAAFTYAAYLLNLPELALLYTCLIGALLGFLPFNLSNKCKVFMGDAGSLSLGYLLVVSAIYMLNHARQAGQPQLVLALIVGVLMLPVIDSLRVYRRRIKNGYSPFRADRTHLHHLVLFLGLKHRSSSVFITLLMAIMLTIGYLAGETLGITFTIIGMLLIFTFVTSVLSLNKKVIEWRQKITELEKCYQSNR